VERWQRKIDHRLRGLWERVPEGDRQHESVRVLLKFSGSIGEIEDLGIQIHSVAGDVASGTITLADVPRIAEAPTVIFVELTQPLMLDV
jgi:hypothetical protein